MQKIFALAALALLLCGSTIFWYSLQLQPMEEGSSKHVRIEIPSGQSVSLIAKVLQEQGLIRSPFAFSLFSKFQDAENSLKAGTYILQPSLSVPEILEILRSGLSEELTVTIPEGFTIKDIDAHLTKLGLIEEGSIVRCAKICDFSSFEFLPFAIRGKLADGGGLLEGYLFPETYFVERSAFVPKFFLERMLGTFRKRVIEGLATDLAKSGRSLHEIVTMASLIEEETRTEEERPVVSGILWKRFDAGRGLDVDAAIRYILGKQSGALTTADLNVNSPYNIRKFRGLPPGPIANPGLSSIIAALRPKDSPYWYYLHGRDGQIRYAETNEEHNINKFKYLR